MITSEIRIQNNNTKKKKSLSGGQKHKFINVKINIHIFKVGFSSLFLHLALENVQS